MNDKKGYLSFSGGMYRVIDFKSALPICADTADPARAFAAAAQMKMTIMDEAWNGDRGEYVHLHTIDELFGLLRALRRGALDRDPIPDPWPGMQP